PVRWPRPLPKSICVTLPVRSRRRSTQNRSTRGDPSWKTDSANSAPPRCTSSFFLSSLLDVARRIRTNTGKDEVDALRGGFFSVIGGGAARSRRRCARAGWTSHAGVDQAPAVSGGRRRDTVRLRLPREHSPLGFWPAARRLRCSLLPHRTSDRLARVW